MKPLKTKISLVLLVLPMLLLHAQGELKSVAGYAPKIGLMVYMLEDLKDRITQQVKDLDQSQIDFSYDADANSIGSLVMHLVSTESYYQIATLEGREWTTDELTRFGIAGELNEEVKNLLKGGTQLPLYLVSRDGTFGQSYGANCNHKEPLAQIKP